MLLLCAPSCLVLVVQCEAQSPATLLKEAMKKGEDEVNPQRDRYVMERLIEHYFEVEREKERGGETESYSLKETEKEGERGSIQ